jgi:signal peptidase I
MPIAEPIAPQQSIPATVRHPGRLHSLLKQARQLCIVACLAFAAYFLISRFLLQSVTVVGLSMSPTLSDSQRYLLNRWVFHIRTPHKSDIVVLRDPLDNGYSVKRVIAVRGDSVYLKDGNVYVNGQRLDEPYLPSGTPTYTSSAFREQFFKCGPNQYFVLGDNRRNSLDSRIYGPVPRQNILGLLIR